MNLAVCTIGCIGAGKTEVAKALCDRHGLQHLDTDKYRHTNDPKDEAGTIMAASRRIAAQYRCVKLGYSFCVDTASRLPIARREMTSTIRSWVCGTPGAAFRVVGIWVHAPLKTCLDRIQDRDRAAEEDTVREYWHALKNQPPNAIEDGFDHLFVVHNDSTLEALQERIPVL